MIPNPIDATCARCKNAVSVQIGKGFWGFPRFKCPSCKKMNRFSTTTGFRIVYGMFLVSQLYVVSGWWYTREVLHSPSAAEEGYPTSSTVIALLALAVLTYDQRLPDSPIHKPRDK